MRRPSTTPAIVTWYASAATGKAAPTVEIVASHFMPERYSAAAADSVLAPADLVGEQWTKSNASQARRSETGVEERVRRFRQAPTLWLYRPARPARRVPALYRAALSDKSYELGTDTVPALRLVAAFDKLAVAV